VSIESRLGALEVRVGQVEVRLAHVETMEGDRAMTSAAEHEQIKDLLGSPSDPSTGEEARGIRGQIALLVDDMVRRSAWRVRAAKFARGAAMTVGAISAIIAIGRFAGWW
jgi:hypothetical protein